ncbi:MAG: adhesin [Pseudomonas sp.]|uniref:adhesin n=1 Tax=Pseudomonas abieticivorans TaxID=2931382 RepID=UPI0020BEBAA4|nr:adhesin [Pseudomonas sp. PIA16]MDE1166556.1 adhesin [Pseudomonas sp.]
MTRTLLVIALIGCSSAYAAGPQAVDNALIDSTGQGYQGSLNVNQAAGDLHQQTNVRAIAIGTQANASTHVNQKLRTVVDPSLNARSAIEGNAFSNGNGALGINQSSGAANQQANAMRLTISAQPLSVDDSALSQQNVAFVRGSDSAAPTSGSRQVTTSDQAFTGSRGLIQLNQSAGVGNSMGNTLSVRVAD